MSLPRAAAIAGLFALAKELSGRKADSPRFATPKLNGIRAMWVPGVGFFSKDGVAYEGGTLPVIEALLKNCVLFLDGELYVHGMSLQQINSIAGVVRNKPHESNGLMQFHVFDTPHSASGFEARQHEILAHLNNINALGTWVQQVPWKLCSCERKMAAAHTAYVSAGYEGSVMKHPGGYIPGASTMMIKQKAWLDEDYEVVRLIQGKDGKYDHSMGAVVCRTKDGVEFEVGSFELTDDERLALWCGTRPAYAKVKFLSLTDGKIPYNSRVIALY